MFPDEDEVDFLQRVNEYSQIEDFGGWKTRKDGSPAVQKLCKESEGDFYICPYCTTKCLPAEVELKDGYAYPCCHKGTMRSLIELEKIRPESKFAKYFFGDDKAATL